MNVGYVSRSFLNKIHDFQLRSTGSGTGSGSGGGDRSCINESSSSSRPTKPRVTAYYLRLDPLPSTSSSTTTATLSNDGVEQLVVVDVEEKYAAQSRRKAEVGMPICLLPHSYYSRHRHRHHYETFWSDSDDDDDDDLNALDDACFETKEEKVVQESAITIHLHPIMMHVLITSLSIMASSQTVAMDDRRWSHPQSKKEHCHVKNFTTTIIPVLLLPTVDNGSMTGRSSDGPSSITGSLEILNNFNDNLVNDTGKDDTDNHANNNDGIPSCCHVAIIHLEYMCSTTAKGRNLFNRTSGTDNSRRQQQQQQREGNVLNQRIRKQLADMAIIAEGGILGIDVDENVDDDLGEDDEYISDDFGNDRNVVFFMVNKIIVTPGDGDTSNVAKTTTTTTAAVVRARYLDISTCSSFDIIMDPSSHLHDDDNNSDVNAVESKGVPKDGVSDIRIKPTPTNRFDGGSLDLNQNNIHFICPGYEPVLEELLLLARMMNNPDAYPTAVLLSGCSGVGKTRMASWFERELSRYLSSSTLSSIKTSIISANDVLLGRSSRPFARHRSGKNFHHHAETHGNVVSGNSTCPVRLLIIDDLDAVIGDADETDTSSHIESEKLRALDAIINVMDNAINDTSRRYFVLGISRASWAQLPPRLARVGRFEKVVAMLPPTLIQRRKIFEFWLSTLLPLQTDADKTARRWAESLAPRTSGCVASDIRRICADALTSAAARVQLPLNQTHSMDEITVSWEDVKEAARTCVPSQLSAMDVIPAPLYENDHVIDGRTEFELAWKTFGGYDEVKKRLYRTVVRPWKYHIMESESSCDGILDGSVDGILGTSKPSGVLLHGPSGCGKSAAAMCLASSLGLHCVKVRASEVFNQWLGGSEAILRSIFSRARAASPCILFFDELDSLAINREGGDSDATSGVQSRILTTLLNEIDGITNVGGMQGVLVVAATNRLEAIDAALLRPGRLEEHVLLSFPKSSCIHQILLLHTVKMPIDSSVDIVQLSDRLEGCKATGAEIEGVCRDACMIAIRRCSGAEALQDLSVTSSDFDNAIHRIKRATAHSSI